MKSPSASIIPNFNLCFIWLARLLLSVWASFPWPQVDISLRKQTRVNMVFTCASCLLSITALSCLLAKTSEELLHVFSFSFIVVNCGRISLIPIPSIMSRPEVRIFKIQFLSCSVSDWMSSRTPVIWWLHNVLQSQEHTYWAVSYYAMPYTICFIHIFSFHHANKSTKCVYSY